MIVTTINPVTGNKVTDLDQHPFVIEGNGVAAMKIYFESEDTKRAYLQSQADIPDWYGDENPLLYVSRRAPADDADRA